MPSGGPYEQPFDPQRASSASTLNTFYTAAGDQTLGHDDNPPSSEMPTGQATPPAADSDAADYGSTRSSDFDTTAATVGTAGDTTSVDHGNGGVADITALTTSPHMQHLSFVNFDGSNADNTAPSTVASRDPGSILAETTAATAGSDLDRPDSSLSDGSTGTVVHEDPATGVRASVRSSRPAARDSTGTITAAALADTGAVPAGQASSVMAGKRPALPSPSTFADHRQSRLVMSPQRETPDVRSLDVATPPVSSDARDYFAHSPANGSRRDTTPAGVSVTSPRHLTNSRTRPPHSRRTSASAYADSERESGFGTFDEDELNGDDDVLGSGSTSDTDDYSDEEERRRARRRHRRRRLRRRRARLRRSRTAATADGDPGASTVRPQDEDDDYDMLSDHEMTLKDRQDAINSSHPFGLPLWKPALYKKDRSVQRAAESAVHSVPSAQLYISVDNVLWMLLAGWWMSLIILLISVPLYFTPGGRSYAMVLRGLSWYLFWPFGRYVERVTGDRWSNSVTDEMRSEWAALERGTVRPSLVPSVYGDITEDEMEFRAGYDSENPDATASRRRARR
ncbi:hypothetical protein THASP1DRAFT_31259, partial [Thamnocephalis sphaerospora]